MVTWPSLNAGVEKWEVEAVVVMRLPGPYCTLEQEGGEGGDVAMGFGTDVERWEVVPVMRRPGLDAVS